MLVMLLFLLLLVVVVNATVTAALAPGRSGDDATGTPGVLGATGTDTGLCRFRVSSFDPGPPKDCTSPADCDIATNSDLLGTACDSLTVVPTSA